MESPVAASKVVPLAEAIRSHIQPNASIHLAYSDARPNAALMEIVRQFDGTQPGFELSTSGLVSVQHALHIRGLLRRVITSFAGENYPAARANRQFQAAVAEGRVSVENWTLYTLIARLMGGALGVEFFPVTSLAGSDLAKEHDGERYAEIDGVFGSETPTGVVKSYRPDVTIIQGVAADPYGNVIMAGPFGEGFWGSMAAKQAVIACVERVVPTEDIRAHNHLALVPGHVVSAVCEVPFGSHPYGLYNPGFPGVSSYVEDHDFIEVLQGLSDHTAAVERWIDEWIIGVGSHEGFLAKVGAAKLSQLRGAADIHAWELEALDGIDEVEDEVVRDSERMVVAAAGVMLDRVRSQQHDAILAGVGFSNLAAWLAAHELRASGDHVNLMAEIGMFGYDPRPGEPFIFSLRNLPSCTLLTDVVSVLGAFVSGPATRTMGAVGAGQIDQYGNVNSTWSDDGTFLVGSGGANDIASAAQEVVVTVKHSARRLTDSVPFVTSPGKRVCAIVTDQAVLARHGDTFVLTAVRVAEGESTEDATARVRGMTGWDLEVADDVAALPEPTAEQLAVIRSFDPRRTFLR